MASTRNRVRDSVDLPDVRPDLRVSFLGDSYVAGFGDAEHRGWVGRVAAWAHVIGFPVTVYNLGVRRDTSADVRSRWQDELRVRSGDGGEPRLVLSFGVNDTGARGGGGRRPTRVALDRSVGNLVAILDGAAAAGIPTLMVGPPAVTDEEHDERIAIIDERFASACAARGVPYVAVFERLHADPVWRADLEAGHGVHPTATGYDRLARLVVGPWCEWLAGGPGTVRTTPARTVRAAPGTAAQTDA